ncbi:hypothetical protein AAY473_015011 [Plecturocebus cupreus]
MAAHPRGVAAATARRGFPCGAWGEVCAGVARPPIAPTVLWALTGLPRSGGRAWRVERPRKWTCAPAAALSGIRDISARRNLLRVDDSLQNQRWGLTLLPRLECSGMIMVTLHYEVLRSLTLPQPLKLVNFWPQVILPSGPLKVPGSQLQDRLICTTEAGSCSCEQLKFDKIPTYGPVRSKNTQHIRCLDLGETFVR